MLKGLKNTRTKRKVRLNINRLVELTTKHTVRNHLLGTVSSINTEGFYSRLLLPDLRAFKIKGYCIIQCMYVAHQGGPIFLDLQSIARAIWNKFFSFVYNILISEGIVVQESKQVTKLPPM